MSSSMENVGIENQKRFDGRAFDELRPIKFEPGIAPNATGSVLVSFGNTKVICACTAEKKVPSWMAAQAPGKGWISAEYAMLPYSTITRKQRASSANKVDGRSMEIQRLIGRSMRAVADLEKINGLVFDKGCYPGQEIISRVQHIGSTPRRMTIVKADSNVSLNANDDVFCDGEACGNVVMSVTNGNETKAIVEVTLKSMEKGSYRIGNEEFVKQPLPYAL